MKLKVLIHAAEEGGYWAEVPGFPGCVSEGETLEEVRGNILEAFAGVLETLQERPGGNAASSPSDCLEVLDTGSM